MGSHTSTTAGAGGCTEDAFHESHPAVRAGIVERLIDGGPESEGNWQLTERGAAFLGMTLIDINGGPGLWRSWAFAKVGALLFELEEWKAGATGAATIAYPPRIGPHTEEAFAAHRERYAAGSECYRVGADVVAAAMLARDERSNAGVTPPLGGARRLVEMLAIQVCTQDAEGSVPGLPCSETSACITEWCWPCHARAVLAPAPIGVEVEDGVRIHGESRQ